MSAPAVPWRDLLTSLVLVAFGAVVVLEAWRMPRFEHLAVNPYTVPGIVPGFLGAIIAVLGFVMLLRASVRGRGAADEAPAPGSRGASARGASARGASALRLALTLVLTLGYAGVLVGRVPFPLATFLFVGAFIVLFGWPAAAGTRARSALVATATLQAAAVAFVVTLVFERLFLVRLP